MVSAGPVMMVGTMVVRRCRLFLLRPELCTSVSAPKIAMMWGGKLSKEVQTGREDSPSGYYFVNLQPAATYYPAGTGLPNAL